MTIRSTYSERTYLEFHHKQGYMQTFHKSLLFFGINLEVSLGITKDKYIISTISDEKRKKICER